MNLGCYIPTQKIWACLPWHKGFYCLLSAKLIADVLLLMSTTNLSILLVDRDPRVRELGGHFLREAGYIVSEAEDAATALEHIKTSKPDLVITEILLPRLDGLALCRQLKEDPATQSIHVLVQSILAAQARAIEAGAVAFLKKPIARDRLLQAVSNTIGRC